MRLVFVVAHPAEKAIQLGKIVSPTLHVTERHHLDQLVTFPTHENSVLGKYHTTMKCLIAVTPHGAAGFVSDLFEGSIDVAIFKESGLMDQIDAGDQYLVDRGFTIQHLLSKKGASIFIPRSEYIHSGFYEQRRQAEKRTDYQDIEDCQSKNPRGTF